MSPIQARVEKGRLVLDEPTTLPEGTTIDLVADDDGDDLTDEERRYLLKGSRYHVYYVPLATDVRVLAVWYARRGIGPPLRAW